MLVIQACALSSAVASWGCLSGLLTKLRISLGTGSQSLQPRGLDRDGSEPQRTLGFGVCIQAVLRGPEGLSLQVAELGLHGGGGGALSSPPPLRPPWDFRELVPPSHAL